MILNIKRLWKNEYFQTAVVIGLIALVVFGFWYGLQVALNTQFPGLAVLSGSMCVPYNSACDGWTSITHPFDRTLHKGDLIIIQGLNPQDLNIKYPNSDIIVFQDPRRPTDPDAKIVHRIVDKVEINGIVYFYTKGDGNSPSKWPEVPDPVYYDNWHSAPSNPDGTYDGAVSQNYVYGKVILRIPWLGHIVLFMSPKRNPWGLSIVIALIAIIVIIEFIVPILRGKKYFDGEKQAQQQS